MFHSKLANIKTLKCTKHACHIVITELKGIRLGGLCISSAEVVRVRLAGFLSPGSQTWPVIPEVATYFQKGNEENYILGDT